MALMHHLVLHSVYPHRHRAPLLIYVLVLLVEVRRYPAVPLRRDYPPVSPAALPLLLSLGTLGCA